MASVRGGRRQTLRTWRITCATLAALVATQVALVPAAVADSVPYTDPGTTGRITLCDVNGQSVTSGSIYVKPFIWRAVGSVPGPGAYASKPGRTAALFAFQPIQNVDPGLWNGEYLTASAKYTNPSLPMAGATAEDPSLHDYLRDYPARWEGMVALRIFLGAPGSPTKTDTYNSSSIRVTGNTWTLIDGGSSPCNSGTTRSAELVLPSVAAMGTPAPNATTDGPPHKGSPSGGTAGSAPGLSGAPSSDAPGASTATSGGAGASVASRPASHSSNGLVWLWIGLAIVAAAGGGAAWWWRGRGARSG